MIEFVPGLRALPRRWVEARRTRRERRHSRTEWASRDAIFFASITARACEAMLWAVIFAIETFGNVLVSLTIAHEYGSLAKTLLLTIGGVSLLISIGCIGMAISAQREWRTAIVRRAARTDEHL